ncbi:MAG: DUF2804 family protein [Acidimicrobiales bacterium]|nr:DUF2804 family protein [Acidimicrobiales bacterium]
MLSSRLAVPGASKPNVTVSPVTRPSTPVYPPGRTPAPAALVDGQRYAYGTFDGPLPVVNPLEVAGRNPVRRALRNLRLKEWEAFQLGNDEWFVLGAVYDTKSLGLLQLLAVNKEAATISRWETKLPSPLIHVARGLDGTRSAGRFRDLSISIVNEISAGALTVDVDHPGSATKPSLHLHGVGRCMPGDAGHLVICHPFDTNEDDRALYSHKAMMPFQGRMTIGAEIVELDAERSFMILDDHHGDYPSPMRYDWITGIRRAPESGRVEGFNLTRNQIRDPHVFNENAIWLGSEVHRLPPVTFERRKGPWGPWRARDTTGAVDVTFTPTVRSAMHVGPKRFLAEYYAPYGWFEGTIEAEHATLVVDGFFGVGEQKMIRV